MLCCDHGGDKSTYGNTNATIRTWEGRKPVTKEGTTADGGSAGAQITRLARGKMPWPGRGTGKIVHWEGRNVTIRAGPHCELGRHNCSDRSRGLMLRRDKGRCCDLRTWKCCESCACEWWGFSKGIHYYDVKTLEMLQNWEHNKACSVEWRWSGNGTYFERKCNRLGRTHILTVGTPWMLQSWEGYALFT